MSAADGPRKGAPTIDVTQLDPTLSTSVSGEDPRLEGAEGFRIGRYRVIRRLGAGGMGVVYLAWDEGLDREIAVKIIGGISSKSTASLTARFKAEAKAMARLNHPHILTVYEIGETNGLPFMAMELAPGGSLIDLLATGAPSLATILLIFIQTADALAAIHRAGLVHRDIKPGNILLDAEGKVRVCDFGLVGLLSESATPAPGASPERRGAGTPAFRSPEQTTGGAVDGRADQYAFCVSLYLAVYGRLPEEGPVVDVPASRGTGQRGHPVPHRLRELLLRGLLPSPADRFETMEAVQRELKLAHQVAQLAEGAPAERIEIGDAVADSASDPKSDLDPTDFGPPVLTGPVELEARLRELPDGNYARGMLFHGVVQRAVEASGQRPPSARERYFPFKKYPVSEHMRLIREAAELAFPQLELRDGLRRLGHLTWDTARASTVGRVLHGLAGGNFAALVRRTAQTYGPMSTGRAIVVPHGPRQIEIRLRNLWTFPEVFHYGIFERVLESSRVEGEVLVRSHSYSSTDLLISWSEEGPNDEGNGAV